MQEDFSRWQKSYQEQKERQGPFMTVSSAPIAPLYAPDNTPEIDFEKDINYSGAYPYTRGVRTNMYRGRLWTMRQFAGFATAVESNQRYKFLLSQGQTGLSVAFDMPTIMGYDSDHPRAYGEVGRVGVAVDSLQDMETLFKDIPLDQVSTSMTTNAPAAILWSMYLVTAEKQGVPAHKLTGTIQNDILKEYIAQKSWIFPPEPSLRLITDSFAFARDHVPKWNTISISGYHIREAGATALQELAFTLADGFAYVEAGIKAGLDVDDFAPRLSFFFNSHTDFFEEIAKYRAARRIWARHMKENYGAKKEESLLLRFHTQTAGCSLTAQQPENNIIRTAYQAMSAVLGGTQSLHTNSMDEVLALPSEKAVQIALRTQQILAYETGIVNTIDPLAGSYFVEALTRQMEEGAEEYFRKIEERGGVLAAIHQNFFQQEIADAAYRYQKEIEGKDRIIVGVNGFQTEEALEIDLLKIDPEIERNQAQRVKELRATRDNLHVQNTLAALKATALSSDNLIPKIIDAVRAYATEGEIVAVLKEVFGEYREQSVF
ncbi:methylmalonyl-CoA mutase, large subunit [Desulfitobacterium hafniense DCB-2]|uniref:Methylmalonyl-CoA mutase family protein n=2 Tax=Desulfitobacterium hafniense TaxID=49338 RepID=G9XM62_DESHA|nr:methylmalonyl-CoA mutase family protein [Desulfitobacterium hafniense]ACL20717.1 methylmalonyl-CoA mutase, large subunit [Desulfitobacterium hafniense DCB-2]EHL07289.1 methylmalonyl-CoA mutase family protein [Desulfitobacterium hafniense DP7]